MSGPQARISSAQQISSTPLVWISSGEAGFRFLFSFPLKFTHASGKFISLCPLCLIHSGIGNDIQSSGLDDICSAGADDIGTLCRRYPRCARTQTSSEVIGEAGFRFLFSFPLKFTLALGKFISLCPLCLIHSGIGNDIQSSGLDDICSAGADDIGTLCRRYPRCARTQTSSEVICFLSSALHAQAI